MRHYSAGFLTALLVQHVAAHGTVNSVSVGGTTYQGYEPSNKPGTQPNPAKGVVWASNDYELGFVLPTDYANANIICHKNSIPAPKAATVAAGGTIALSWPNWPATDPHPGVFLNYLAPAGTDDPAKIDKNSLKFFKISQAGYDPSVAVNGDDKGLATGSFKKAGRVAQVQIPANIKAGTYVLRHEIIALHEAETINKAQNYPQCVTIQVTGGGSDSPAGVPATTFYKATDPGILVKNFYDKWDPKAYVMPGPSVMGGGSSTAAAVASPASGAASSAGSIAPAAAAGSSSAGSSSAGSGSGSGSSSPKSSGSSGGAQGGYSQKGSGASSGSGSGTSSASPAAVSIIPAAVPSVAASPASSSSGSAAPAAAASSAGGDDEEEGGDDEEGGDKKEDCKKNKKGGQGKNRKQKQKSSSYERRHARDLMQS